MITYLGYTYILIKTEGIAERCSPARPMVSPHIYKHCRAGG